MPAHTSSSHEATVGIVVQLLAVHRSHLFLLASPVLASGSSAVEGAVEIGSDDLAVVVDFAVEHGALSPWDTGIGDEDVETAIEFLDDLINHLIDVFGIGDVDLVGLACYFQF